MSIVNRTEKIGGIWAEDAIDLPGVGTPTTGTTYAASAMTAQTMKDAWPYKETVSSGHFNEMLRRITTLLTLCETVGILPYCSLTEYTIGSVCMGTDGNLHQSKTSGNLGNDPVTDTAHDHWLYFPNDAINATNLLGGAKGSTPYQSAANTTLLLPAGTAGYVKAMGSDSLPTWVDPATLETNKALNGVPPGAVFHLATQTIPRGFLFCDGSTVSRVTYADLFSAIGITWGSGDGSTTFNLPDLRGTFIRSIDSNKGLDAGRSFASYQADELAAHTHSIVTKASSPPQTGSATACWSGETATVTGSTGGVETRPKNYALTPVIKT